MSLDTWSGRDELLNEFHAAIQRRTHGRLSHLSLNAIDGALVVEAHSATYYAVQLALAAIQAFATDFPKLTPAKMSFRVNGHPLVLDNSLVQCANGRLTDIDDSIDDSDGFVELDRDTSSSSPLQSLAVATATTN